MLESENQTVACSVGAGQRPTLQPASSAQRRPLLPSPLLRPLADLFPRAWAPKPDAPARPPGPDAPSAQRQGKEAKERGCGRGLRDARQRWASAPHHQKLKTAMAQEGTAKPLPPAKTSEGTATDLPCRCQRLPRKSPAVEGDALVPEPPPLSRPLLSFQVLLHPPDCVRTQRPPHRPPKREGDASSYLRRGRRTTRRRLECAGHAEASTVAAAGELGLTTRLPAGALPPQPSPHPFSRRILRRSLQSPRAGRERERSGRAPRGGGPERWLF